MSTRPAPHMMGAVFIVGWEGDAPLDKAEWIAVLRDTLASELGSYRVVFRPEGTGWRFTLDWKEPEAPEGEEDALVANSPESVAFNIYAGLAAAGKPIDPAWRPHAAVAPTASSASPVSPPSPRASGTRRTPGR